MYERVYNNGGAARRALREKTEYCNQILPIRANVKEAFEQPPPHGEDQLLIIPALTCIFLSPQICHSKSGEINPKKIHSLIISYVKRCKYINKKNHVTVPNPGAPTPVKGKV